MGTYEVLDLTSTGDEVDAGFLKCKNNWATLEDVQVGAYRRSSFGPVDDDTITVGSGVYEVNGTITKITSTITTTAHGEAGTDFVYLYIDYSEIPSDNVLLQATLIWSTTEPSWSDSLLGWYNGNDRCIFAVSVVSGAILEFRQEGNYVSFADSITVEAEANYTSFAAMSAGFTVPIFSNVAEAVFFLDANGHTAATTFT